MEATTGWDPERSLPCVLGKSQQIKSLHDPTLWQTQKYLIQAATMLWKRRQLSSKASNFLKNISIHHLIPHSILYAIILYVYAKFFLKFLDTVL